MTYNRQLSNRVPIYVDGKPVYLVTERILTKRFRKQHLLNRPPALAADVAVLKQAIELGAEFCQFTSIETGDVYFAPIAWLQRYGLFLNRGHGAQKALPLEYWSVNGCEPQRRPTRPSSKQRRPQNAPACLSR